MDSNEDFGYVDTCKPDEFISTPLAELIAELRNSLRDLERAVVQITPSALIRFVESRLHNVYGESENSDYMRNLRQLADKLEMNGLCHNCNSQERIALCGPCAPGFM